MKLYRMKLKPQGSFLTNFTASSLFGGLCWTYRYQAGEDKLTDLLKKFASGVPPFVFSSGFPGDLLPKPLLPGPLLPTVEQTSQINNKAELIIQIREAKRTKKIYWLTLEEFQMMATGRICLPIRKEKQFIQVSNLHNQINRLNGTSTELFELEEIFLNPDTQYLSVYIRVEPEWYDLLDNLFRGLGKRGVGKRKSIGKGLFTVEGIEEYPVLDHIPHANGFITLSPFLPARDNPVEGYYKQEVLYSKLDQEYALSGNPFKRPVVMLSVGSAFKTTETVKPYYGCMAQKVSPQFPEVLQYGYALAVPAFIPEANN